MKHNRVIISVSIIGLAVLLLMLNLTSPTDIGPVGVLLFFTTVYVVCFGVITLIWHAFRSVALKKTRMRSKDYLYAAVMAFGPIMLLVARSFGAISLWTVSLIVLFVILAEFLVYKRI